MTGQDLSVTLEFSGGAELLVGNKKKHQVTLKSDDQTWNIKRLLTWMKEHMLTERPELFLQDDTVRPGLLVLVNDTDWELLGELEYKIQSNDSIVFISTLHGG